MEENTPIFVKIDEYKEILDIVDVVKHKISQAKDTLSEINRLKMEEDQEVESWQKNIADVESKMQSIRKKLFEPNV